MWGGNAGPVSVSTASTRATAAVRLASAVCCSARNCAARGCDALSASNAARTLKAKSGLPQAHRARLPSHPPRGRKHTALLPHSAWPGAATGLRAGSCARAGPGRKPHRPRAFPLYDARRLARIARHSRAWHWRPARHRVGRDFSRRHFATGHIRARNRLAAAHRDEAVDDLCR